MGLRLLHFDGRPADRRQRLLRLASGCLSLLPLGVGFLWALVDEERLTFHDHISRDVPHPGQIRPLILSENGRYADSVRRDQPARRNGGCRQRPDARRDQTAHCPRLWTRCGASARPARMVSTVFRTCPSKRRLAKEILGYAGQVRGSYDTVCLVGIGGSALGAWALDCGIRGPHPVQGAFSASHPRLVILDNVDPSLVERRARFHESEEDPGGGDRQVGLHGRDGGDLPDCARLAAAPAGPQGLPADRGGDLAGAKANWRLWRPARAIVPSPSRTTWAAGSAFFPPWAWSRRRSSAWTSASCSRAPPP